MMEIICAMWLFLIKKFYMYMKKEVLNRTNQNNVSISIHQAIFSKDTSKLQSVLEDFMLKKYINDGWG